MTVRKDGCASVAQLVEQRTFNPRVQGSSPCGGTQYDSRKDGNAFVAQLVRASDS